MTRRNPENDRAPLFSGLPIRRLVLTMIAVGFVMIGLPLPLDGPHPGFPMTAALADDDDDNGDGGGGGNTGGAGGAGGNGERDDRDARPPIGSQLLQGDGYSAAREILAIDADPAIIRRRVAGGFVARERRTLPSLRVSISRLTIPTSMGPPAALALARQIAPSVAYEPNPV